MVRKMAGTVISASIRIMLVLAVLCLLYYGGTKGFEFGESVFSPKTLEEAPGTDIEVTITQGMDAEAVGKLLEKSGLIKDYKVFWIQTKLYDYSFAAGNYVLNTSMTPEEMLEIVGEHKADK